LLSHHNLQEQDLYRAFRNFILFLFCSIACGGAPAFAQSNSTTSRGITPSVFAGATGVETGLASGRNLGLTAGVDIAFRPNSRLQPAIEYRGMYAIDKGGVDSLKNDVGGIKLSTSYGRLRPYVDLLAGRGETTYANGGYQVPNKLVFYTQSSSDVYSPGGGVEFFATRKLGVKVDFQIQRYSSPVAVSGHVYSETGTVGFVYVFHLGRAPV
jgi:hypothetical protein